MNKYKTACKETGTTIDEFNTLEQAEQAISDYEQEDKANGCYTPDFYTIVIIVVKRLEIIYTTAKVVEVELDGDMDEDAIHDEALETARLWLDGRAEGKLIRTIVSEPTIQEATLDDYTDVELY